MMIYKRISGLALILLALLGAVLACNLPGVGDDNPTQQSTTAENQPAEQPDAAQAAAGAREPGFSRSNPYPPGTEVNTTYWDFKVLEVLRGQAAYDLILSQDPQALPAPAGKEYLLVKVWVRCKNPEPGSHDIDLDTLFITGDRLRGYADHLWDIPQPEFFYSDIFTAESLEGWIDVLVEVGESNLMLVFDREEYFGGEDQPRETRYLALEPGSALSIPADVLGIAPNELGKDKNAPARIGETVILADWELTILEVRRGQAALDLARELNEKNDIPDEGVELLAFRVRARRIGGEDVPRRATADYFRTYTPGQGRNGSDQMEDPQIYLDPQRTFPYLRVELFPGGQAEGWVFKVIPTGYTPAIVQFAQYDRPSPWDTRYFSLEP